VDDSESNSKLPVQRAAGGKSQIAGNDNPGCEGPSVIVRVTSGNRWAAATALAAALGLLDCTQTPSTSAPSGAAGTGGSSGGLARDGGAGSGAQAGAAGDIGGIDAGAGTAGMSGSAGEAGAAGSGGAAGASSTGGGGGPGGQGGSAAGAGGSGGTAGVQGGAGGQPAGGRGGDSSTIDGGAGGAGGTGSCPGLLCEDFESGSIDAAKWDTSSKGGTLAVQTQQVAHGKYALHLQGLGSGSDDWATLFAKNVPAALKSATTFGRASMYFSAAVSASLHIQFSFAGSNGTGSGTGPAPVTKLRYLEVGSYNGQWQLSMDMHDVTPNIEDSAYAGSNIPTNKWVCVEWELEDQPERITLWVGGTQAGVFDNMHINYSSDGTKSGGTFYQGKNNGLIGVFDTFGIGFHDWHPAKVFDVYYDDVVLDTKRIGCPAP
jgi:hypothetical protein